jgi:NADPH-dependent curcumin reductase CurA
LQPHLRRIARKELSMSTLTNRLYRLAARPVGLPKPSDWQYEEAAVPELQDGQLLVQTLYISLDPAMRGWMNEGKSYVPPVGIGEVMRADVQRIDMRLAPLPKFMGVLGMPGTTAYFGLLDVGALQEGETVLVSAASGAVGQIVGQIAKLKGCRVIGIAGGPEKCRYVVDELGFDGCIDYKNQPLHEGLKQQVPDGIDVYFDNVGGEMLDAALGRLRMKARVVICGAISQYNNTTPIQGPRNYMSLLVNRARMEGFVVFDYSARYGEAIEQMAQWLRAGKLKSREDIVDGIENFPATLLKLFSGENFGKLILRVAQE